MSALGFDIGSWLVSAACPSAGDLDYGPALMSQWRADEGNVTVSGQRGCFGSREMRCVCDFKFESVL